MQHWFCVSRHQFCDELRVWIHVAFRSCQLFLVATWTFSSIASHLLSLPSQLLPGLLLYAERESQLQTCLQDCRESRRIFSFRLCNGFMKCIMKGYERCSQLLNIDGNFFWSDLCLFVRDYGFALTWASNGLKVIIWGKTQNLIFSSNFCLPTSVNPTRRNQALDMFLVRLDARLCT